MIIAMIILRINVLFDPTTVPDSTRAHASDDKAPNTAACDLHTAHIYKKFVENARI